MKKLSITALTVALAATLAACSPIGGETSPAPTPPPAAVQTEAPAGDSVERPEADVVEEPRDDIGTFGGDGYASDNGLKLGISAPKEYTPSEWSLMEGDKGPWYKFTVTVQNDTGAAWDPSMFYTTMSSGGVEMVEQFDMDNKLDGSPMTPVLDGKSISFDIGYSVVDVDDMVMNVTLDWDHENVLFTN